MRLVHFSADIVTRVKGRRQFDPMIKKNVFSAKPRGFWVSDETRGAGGWRSWCLAERFRPYAMRYEHEVQLVPGAKILYIHTAADLHKFTKEYGYSLISKVCEARDDPYRSTFIDSIDWRRVARKWHGIIITPYIWSERLGNLQWYYSWDCASGCIWNPRAIASITLVKERKAPKKPTLRQERLRHKRWQRKMKELTADMPKWRTSKRQATAKVQVSQPVAAGDAVTEDA